jgi:hypothetical protein
MIDDLNDDNFMIFAMKTYDKPHCVMSEFEEDLKRIKYIKRLIKRYKVWGEDELKERLILNHIIVLSNVFGIESTVKMLFFKFDPEDYPILKAFLIFLNFMPTQVKGIKGFNISSVDVPVDVFILTRLRTI